MYNDIVPEFESLIDQISNSFFNYEERLFPAFLDQKKRVLKELPWNGMKHP